MNEIQTNPPIPLAADGGQRIETPSGDAKPRPEGTTRPLPEDAVIILPVRNMVLFPGLVVPLTIGRETSRAAAQEAVRLQRPLGILLQKDPEVDAPGPDDLHWSAPRPTCCAISRPTARTTPSARARAASACCSSSRA